VSAAITRPVAGTSRTARPRSAAAQVKAQRRGYAQAVLASLARSLKGQPTAVVQRTLKNALGPSGFGRARPGCSCWPLRSRQGNRCACPDRGRLEGRGSGKREVGPVVGSCIFRGVVTSMTRHVVHLPERAYWVAA